MGPRHLNAEHAKVAEGPCNPLHHKGTKTQSSSANQQSGFSAPSASSAFNSCSLAREAFPIRKSGFTLPAGQLSFAVLVRPDGGIGRRSRLKIYRPQGLGGSTPPLGTSLRQAGRRPSLASRLLSTEGISLAAGIEWLRLAGQSSLFQSGRAPTRQAIGVYTKPFRHSSYCDELWMAGHSPTRQAIGGSTPK